MPDYDNDHLCSLRAALLDHPIYTNIGSVADLSVFQHPIGTPPANVGKTLELLAQEMGWSRSGPHPWAGFP